MSTAEIVVTRIKPDRRQLDDIAVVAARAFQFDPFFDSSCRRREPQEPLWYIALLVVDPSMQRSGIGARLQERVLETADETGVDCYLETQNSENLVYYRRFRYEVVDELHPVAGGPPLWAMRRPANS